MPDLSDLMSDILAANIKALRMRTASNQAAFGELLDVSQGTVARWESGVTPRGDTLVKLAEMAGVPLRQFTTQLVDSQQAPVANGTNLSGSLLLLPVTLPSEDDLTDMFGAQLDVLREERDPDVIARRLAQMLPGGLAQTVARQRFDDRAPGPASFAADAPPARGDHAPLR